MPLCTTVQTVCPESMGKSGRESVHRIDMDTTGALIVCKNDTAHTDIAEQIKEHTVTRRYRGIVCGVVEDEYLLRVP